jgi:hypothetical protein
MVTCTPDGRQQGMLLSTMGSCQALVPCTPDGTPSFSLSSANLDGVVVVVVGGGGGGGGVVEEGAGQRGERERSCSKGRAS